MADLFIYNKSLEEQDNLFLFENRQWLPCADSNAGSYPSSTINFDLTQLSNSGRVIDWGNSLLEIPIQLQLSGLTGGTHVQNAFAATMKNFSCLVSSMSVNITNYDCVTLTNNSNLDIQYKLISSYSQDDLETIATATGFHKDNAQSVVVREAPSALGIGECNNIVKNIGADFSPVLGYNAQPRWVYNDALGKRALDTSWVNSGAFINDATAASVRKNRCTLAATTITYNIVATMPLRQLHDIFDQMPLVRGAYMRLTFNTNINCRVNFTMTDNTGTSYNAYSTSSQNGVCPFVVSPIGANTDAGSATGLSPIGAAAFSAVSSISGQCTIRACSYAFSPVIESQYFSNPNKKVLYDDILSFSILNVASGQQINQILSNGISRMRSVLIVPQISGGAGGTELGRPMDSPFSSSPSTTAPFAYLTNMNLLISGQALYQQNILYGYEHYLEEIRQSGSVNGGLENGRNSGTLSFPDWQAGYHYMYFDLSRKSGLAQDNVAKSLQLIGQNASVKVMDYYVIVRYQREITINTSNGSLVF